jgi:uncharacterized protein YgiM (DUF1202 family)
MKIEKFTAFCLITLFVSCGIGSAQEKYPYVAQVIGDNVNIRAGAGVNHYRCGRVSEPTTVVVTAEQFGFARIKPPKGSFSWIAEQSVRKIDEAAGEVTSDNVRVWAGSPYVSAVHSSSSQVTLDKGDKVKFAGKPESGYYKIHPPEGASLWINSAYIKYMGPLSKFMPENDKELPAEPQVEPGDDTAKDEEKSGDEPSDDVLEGEDIDLDKPLSEDIDAAAPDQGEQAVEQDETPEEAVEPKENSQETDAIEAYLEQVEKVKLEKQKPLAVQDYTAIVTDLEQIIEDPKNGRAVNFARALMDVVERYQVARLADASLREQDSELVKIRSEIRKNLKKEIEDINATTGYVMIGTLARSYVYTTKSGDFRYSVKDDKDSIIAYAVPAGADLKSKAEKLIGKKVGFVGDVSPDENTSKVVIEFSDIKEIWEPKDSE